MTNSKRLRELIYAKGLKLGYIAECLNLSTFGLQLKIDNENEFKSSEIEKLCKILEITSLQDKEDIFFLQVKMVKNHQASGGVGIWKVNTHKLKTVMYEREITQIELAERLGIDRGTLTSRFNNDGFTFRLKEIYLIIEILKLSEEEVKSIFFYTDETKDIDSYII